MRHADTRTWSFGAFCALAAALLIALPAPAQESQPADATKTDETKKADLSQEVRLTEEGTFELHVPDADIRLVLKQLSTLGKRNIIVSQAVEGTVTADLYNVTLDEALEAVLKSSNLASVKQGNFIYVYTAAEFAAMRKQEHRVYKLAYLEAEEAKKYVEGVLSETAKIMVAEDTDEWSRSQEGNRQILFHPSREILVIYDFRENLDAVSKIIEELDTRPDQVLIETTILSAVLDDNNALGVNIDALTGTQLESFIDPNTGLSSLTDLLSMSVPSTERANLNKRQMRVNSPFNANTANDGSPFTMGILWDNVAVFIEALEAITDTTIIANPKLQVVNRQIGEVLIGNRDGYLTTTVSQTAATQEVEFLETGTKLLVIPFIGRDGYIRLFVHPEISEGGVNVPAGTTTALPSSRTTQATSSVMVRDGKTVVVGGLFRERTQTDRRQLPLIGDVPVVGDVFGNTRDESTREEVIILLTPHLVGSPADEAVAERLKNDVERVRVGSRNGIAWWSKGRLADLYMQEARKAARNGNEGLARWNTDIALYLQPRMKAAIDLKEQLTEEAYWANQPQFCYTRSVISQMIGQQLGVPAEAFTSPDRPLDVEKIDPRVRQALGVQPKPYYSIIGQDVAPVEPAPVIPPAAPAEPAPANIEKAPEPAAPQPIEEGGDSAAIETAPAREPITTVKAEAPAEKKADAPAPLVEPIAPIAPIEPVAPEAPTANAAEEAAPAAPTTPEPAPAPAPAKAEAKPAAPAIFRPEPAGEDDLVSDEEMIFEVTEEAEDVAQATS